MIDALRNFFKDKPSEKLSELFAITKKGEAVKLCHKLFLTNSDISQMIMGCESLGYYHTAVFEDNDVSRLWKDVREKFESPDELRRLHSQLYKESSRSIFHFFVSMNNPDVWHLLTWDSRDGGDDTRFVHGAHVHFINHLWVRPSIHEIVRAIPTRPHGAHIRTTE